MNWRIIGTLIAKDFSLFFRKKFFTAMTIFGFIIYLVLYFIMPSSVNESFKIGLYAPVPLPVFAQLPEEGVEIDMVESEEALKEAVIDGKYVAGVALPADIMEKFNAGEKPTISLYFTADVPDEAKDSVKLMIQELAYMQTGQPLSIELTGEILGPDTIGQPVPPRDRLRPLLAVFILMVEMLGLANLITEEVEGRTIQALLVTPMSVPGLFIAKGITGTGLAFGQSLLFMALVGGMSGQPLLILVTLLLGAVMVTGAAFLISSASKDFMSVLGWSIPALIILIVPTFSILFPGAVTGWVKVIPSYYLVDTVHRAANFGSGWGDLGLNLLILLGFCLVITWLGIAVLRRKLR